MKIMRRRKKTQKEEDEDDEEDEEVLVNISTFLNMKFPDEVQPGSKNGN